MTFHGDRPTRGSYGKSDVFSRVGKAASIAANVVERTMRKCFHTFSKLRLRHPRPQAEASHPCIQSGCPVSSMKNGRAKEKCRLENGGTKDGRIKERG